MTNKLSIVIFLLICFGLSNLSAQKPVISGYFGKKSFIGFKYHTMIAAFPTPSGDHLLLDGDTNTGTNYPLTHQFGLEFGKTFTRSLNLYAAVKTTRLGAQTAISKTINNTNEAIDAEAFVNFRAVVAQLGIDFKSKKYWSMPPVGKYAGLHLYYAKALQPSYISINDSDGNTLEKYEDCDCTATLSEENKTSGFGLIFASGYRNPIFKSFYYNIGGSLGIAFGGGKEERLVTRARQSQFFTIDLSFGKLF